MNNNQGLIQKNDLKMNEVYLHENKLLKERNQLLTIENQKLLSQLEHLKVESYKFKTTSKQDYKNTYRRNRQQRQQYQELILLRAERDQILNLYKQRIPFLKNKLKDLNKIANSDIIEKIQLFIQLENSNSYTGMTRLLFEMVDACLLNQKDISIKLKVLRDKENYIKVQESITERSLKNNKQKVIMIKDPQYVVSQTQWISKFEDEFNIVKNFYEKIINQIIKKQQISQRKNLIHNILIKYEKMELKKIELYKLALKIQNQQREFNIKSSQNFQMESLRLSSNKLLETLCEQENQLKRLKIELSQLIEKL